MPSVPPELAAVIDRALAFDQAQRWPTAAAMREAWNAASASVRKSASSADTLSVLLQGFQPRASEAPGPFPASSATHFEGTRAASPADGRAASRANARRFALIGGIGALLVAALATAWVLGSRSAGGRAEAELDASSSGAAATPPPPSTSVTVSVEEPARAAPAAEVPAPSPQRTDVRPRTGRPAPKAARNATPADAPSAKPAAPAAPPPNCQPPYDLDSQGVKIWKRGCL
jgi:serine/threonine-protein kinase